MAHCQGARSPGLPRQRCLRICTIGPAVASAAVISSPLPSTALPLLQSKLAGLNSSNSPPTPSASPAIRATVIASPSHSAAIGIAHSGMV